MIYNRDNRLFATEFTRIVRGARGTYVEFTKDQIVPLLVNHFDDKNQNEKDYYYFSRNTEDTVYVNVCDKDYNIEKQISLDEYTKQLSELYNIFVQSISFRDIVGRYIRVYGKDNLDEKQDSLKFGIF